MKHLPSDGHEHQTDSHEKIEVIGRPLPALHELEGQLSDVPDIRVHAEAESLHRNGSVQIDVSEAEIVRDLLDFCSRVSALPTDRLDEKETELVESVGTFVDSIHFLTHEAYAEAIDGLAGRHSTWLEENENRRVRFVVQRNRMYSSQAKVAQDIATAISTQSEDLSKRVDVCSIASLADNLKPDTKLVCADDWSVSGNLIAQDIAHVYQMFNRKNVNAQIEVDLLLAREDQVADGVSTIPKLQEFYNIPVLPEIVAYYSTQPLKGIFGPEATPSGSHSSADYGFSTRLDEMCQLLSRYETGDTDVHMPYAAEIIPTYHHTRKA